MPFPFIAPLKYWVKTKLENREKTPYETHRLSPFVIISSGAIVTNTNANGRDEINKIIKNGPSGGKTFKGCVISNQSEFSKLYQTSNTTLGYDLDGNSITIDGEVGRKISTPIIQSVEIDTDGGNNTLKIATIKVKCFSLKQLEMFDLFFLRPSMYVMLEYGWNADIIKRNDKIHTKLFAKLKYDIYVKTVSAIFANVRDSVSTYLTTLSETDGNYDYMAGVVTKYSYSPGEDGTYDIDLEISAGNELQLWMPIVQSTKKSVKLENSSDIKDTEYNSWVRKLSNDFNQSELITLLSNESVWKNEFFNWDILNDRDDTKVVSFHQYISFKLILKLLETPQLFTSNPIIKIKYKDSLNNPVIPMNSDKYMISSSEDIIIPNQMPEFKFAENKKDVLIIDDTKYNQNYKGINGKIFNLTDTKLISEIARSNSSLISDTDVNDIKYGNLLNMFFKYETILRIYKQSFTQADFINGILAMVNENTYGLCKMELMALDDVSDSNGKILQIIDYKILNKPVKDDASMYRFKIGPSGSIVREFSFSMELSTLASAQALYQSQLNLNTILDKDAFSKDANGQLGLNDDRYSLFDMSYAKNTDNYFSINEIGKNVVINSAVDRLKKEKEDKLTLVVISDKDANNLEVDKKITNLSELVNSKSIKFKISKKETKTLIFLDRGVILNKLKKAQKNVSVLTFFEITLAIDGIAGLSCGEYFKIDGIPEIYNKNGVFQIKNVKHGIDESGWKTTIEAGYLIRQI
jgi:hypothetical protein